MSAALAMHIGRAGVRRVESPALQNLNASSVASVLEPLRDGDRGVMLFVPANGDLLSRIAIAAA